MLDTVIEFIARIDVVLYFLCALGMLIGLRSFALARRQRKVAVFGLEREAARALRRRAYSMLGSMIALAGSVYLLTNVIKPTLETMPVVEGGGTPTPTTMLTPQTTASPPPLLFPTVTPTFGIAAPGGEAAEPLPTPADDGASTGCDLIGVTITSPLPGEVVAGQVNVQGEANILNFAAYKFEVNGPSTGGAWATVGSFTTPVASGFLGSWDATSLAPGSYSFRLVVVDTSGNFPEPCAIPITIAAPGAQPIETTPESP